MAKLRDQYIFKREVMFLSYDFAFLKYKGFTPKFVILFVSFSYLSYLRFDCKDRSQAEIEYYYTLESDGGHVWVSVLNVLKALWVHYIIIVFVSIVDIIRFQLPTTASSLPYNKYSRCIRYTLNSIIKLQCKRNEPPNNTHNHRFDDDTIDNWGLDWFHFSHLQNCSIIWFECWNVGIIMWQNNWKCYERPHIFNDCQVDNKLLSKYILSI